MGKSCDCMALWGTKAERGQVTEKTGSGSSAVYTVRSYDRPGLVFSGIKAETEVAVDDKVCFFGFSDGTGRIIYKL